MNKVSVFASAKVLTAPECVKLTPAQTYTDTIIKGNDYDDVTQKVVSVVNYCNVPFSVGEIILFSDVVNGGNFTAKIKAFTIQANQTLNLPVYYDGMYLGDSVSPSYTITLNGVTNMYNLNITVPVVNQPPVVTDINKSLDNRAPYTLLLTDFTTHFSDVDGDTLDAVILEGNLSLYRLNGNPITSPATISASDISSGYLTKLPQDTDNYVEDTVTYKAIDSAGNTSL